MEMEKKSSLPIEKLGFFHPLQFLKRLCNFLLTVIALIRIINSLLPFPYFFGTADVTKQVEDFLMKLLSQYPWVIILRSCVHFINFISLLKHNVSYMLEFHLPILLATIAIVSLSLLIHERERKIKKLKQLPRRLVRTSFSLFHCIIICLIHITILHGLPYSATSLVHNHLSRHITYLFTVRLREDPWDIILPSWIRFSFIYLLKLNLLSMLHIHLPILLFTIATVSLTSVMDEKENKMKKLKELLRRMISISKWKDSLIKLTCVSIMSFAIYVAVLNWLAAGPFLTSYFLTFQMFNIVLYLLGFIAVLVKWTEFIALRNLGVAMSEEIYDLEAWKMASFFRMRKFFTVVIHYTWCVRISLWWLLDDYNYKPVVYSGIIKPVLYGGLIWWRVI